MPREKSLTSTTPRKPATRKAPARKQAVTAVTPFIGPEYRAALIAEAAYLRAEKRGFIPGHETEDWLAAEAEVDTRLMQGQPAAQV